MNSLLGGRGLVNFLNNLKVKFSDVLLIFWAKDGFFFSVEFRCCAELSVTGGDVGMRKNSF